MPTATDPKLAKGFTREGFRRDLKGAAAITDQMHKVLAPYYYELRNKGKLRKESVKSLIGAMYEFKSEPHLTLFIERFIQPGLRMNSPQYEAAIAGGYFSSMSGNLFGFEEKVRMFGLFYDRYSRHEIEIRTLDLPIFIREHAISRFIERSGGKFQTAVQSLWPGFLIISALEIVEPLAIARPFMLPVPEGAFLGMSVLDKWDQQKVKCFTRTRKTFKEDYLHDEAADVVSMSFINTFISTEQMSRHQLKLNNELVKLIENHRDMLLFNVLHKIMIVGGEEDIMGLEKALFGNIEDTFKAFSKLVASSTWSDGVRAPQDGGFVDYFIAQGVLEGNSPSGA